MKEESENVGVKFNIQKTKIMASGPITRGKYMGKQWKQWKQCQTLFFGASKSLQMVIAAIKLKEAYSLEGQLRPTYMVLEKSLESPLDCKEIQPVHSSVLSLLHSPTLTSIHDYWKNHSLDYTDVCCQSSISAF